MNYKTYIAAMNLFQTRGSSKGLYSPAVANVSFVQRWQSAESNYFSSHEMRTWHALIQSIAGDYCCFSQRAIHGIHRPCSHRSVVQVMWAYAMSMFTLFVFSTLHIILNQNTSESMWTIPVSEIEYAHFTELTKENWRSGQINIIYTFKNFKIF